MATIKPFVIIGVATVFMLSCLSALSHSTSKVSADPEKCLTDTSQPVWGPCPAINGGTTDSETTYRGGGRPTHSALRALL